MRAKTSQACSPFEATATRICAHVAPASCQGLLADALSAAESSDDRCKGGCSPGDPVSIPHDIENRGVATRIDQQRNPQVSGAFQRSTQVTESARLNLSRWRHGFEPRWDQLPNMQVTGRVRADVSHQQATPGPIDPVSIPSQVGTRRLHRRSGDTGACLSLRVLSHHRQDPEASELVSTWLEWRHSI
jgi:hypothetical protein